MLKIKGGLYLILKHKKLLSSDPLKRLSPWPLCNTHTVRRKPRSPGSSRQIPQVSPGQEAEQGERPRGIGGKETGEEVRKQSGGAPSLLTSA